jgi:predicted transcriptional regulator
MPEEFSIDELMEKLFVLNKIEIGLKQAEKGESYTTEEAKKLLREWSK